MECLELKEFSFSSYLGSRLVGAEEELPASEEGGARREEGGGRRERRSDEKRS